MRERVFPAIRPYEAGDHDGVRVGVVQLQDAGREIDRRLRTGESMADEYLEQMHARCREQAGTLLVAVHADTIIGFVMLLTRVPHGGLDEPPGHYALVAELVVLDGFRGRGVGRALLQEAERLARESRASELRIGVLSQNTPARQLYLDEGFLPYSEFLTKSIDPHGLPDRGEAQ